MTAVFLAPVAAEKHQLPFPRTVGSFSYPASGISSSLIRTVYMPLFLLPTGCDRLLGAYSDCLKNHHRFEILRKVKWAGRGGLAENPRPCRIMRVCRHVSAVQLLRTVAFEHVYQNASPKRCFRQRVGLRAPVSGPSLFTRARHLATAGKTYSEVKRGFVLLTWRWVVEQRFRMGILFLEVGQSMPSLVPFSTGRSLSSVRVHNTL